MAVDKVTVGILAAGVILLTVLGTVYVLPPDERAPEPSVPTPPAENQTVHVVAENLDVPWGIEFLPDGDMLVTERTGTLLRVDDNTGKRYPVEGVEHRGEGGLLGVEAHPDFAQNNHIYLYMTASDPDGSGLINRVTRYTLEENTLSNPETLISDIPGAVYHDGGRMEFGPDGLLYITTGDSGNAQLAQDRDSLAGKILRLNPDGSVPANNPFGTPIYSYGHRNPQGLAWDENGNLWATEHGNRRHDELNLIRAGNNYGWPVIEADQSRQDMEQPKIYADDTTWAPAGAAYVDGNIVFAGLRGQSLYAAELSGESVTDFTQLLENEYGRLRAVELGADGYLYVSTSNTDGRGNPAVNDDRILQIDLARLLS